MARLAAPTAPPALVLVGGAYVLDIPDADAESHLYTIERCDGLGRWGVLLTRMDTRAKHHVSIGLDGRWRCSCKDMEHGNRTHRSRPRGAPCKHRDAVEPLWPLVEKLAPKREEDARA